MWTHIQIKPEDGDDPIDIDRLHVPGYGDLDIHYEPTGNFYIEAIDNCGDDTFIGLADELSQAKRKAEAWLLRQIAAMLRGTGAEGIWLLRGAEQVTLAYQVDDKMLGLELAEPSELVILIRIPAGDGGEPGIEHL